MPPPDLHIETWLETVDRMRKLQCKVIAPTHFGFFEDEPGILDQLEKNLVEVLSWLPQAMKDDPSLEIFEERFFTWNKERLLNIL
jgi:L-ascorbate metabolism protein UlaG (beta-lactamase superfamily)